LSESKLKLHGGFHEHPLFWQHLGGTILPCRV
jgi:hypothetical protein